MRTLTEITNAVRRNQHVTTEEMRYAIVVYDVLIAQMGIAQHREQLELFFVAAESDPREFAGIENDPENSDAVEWHTKQINMTPIFGRAKEPLK